MILNVGLTIGLALTGSAVDAFQFPKIKFVGLAPTEDDNAPQVRIKKGPAEATDLRQSLEKYCNIIDDKTSDSETCNISLRWEPDVKEGYQVADIIFKEIEQCLSEQYKDNTNANELQSILSFPSIKRQEDLTKLSDVLNSEKGTQLLGIQSTSAELYPTSPAPYLRIKFSNTLDNDDVAIESATAEMGTEESTTSATKNWVNNFLGKYRLCPYTSSVTRAAVGLSSVGVPVGGVHVRVENTNADNSERISYNKLRAARLVSSFWSEIVALMQSPQEEWSTSLVVFQEYDTEFEAFYDVCDSIVEPTVVATQSTDFIGRAWFHPRYDADAVGHSSVIAGHAIPHKMVEGFMKSLDRGSLEYDELVKANNKLRQTPHATINILRRNQLNAAGEYEKGLGEKRPKANAIYVRNAVRLSDALKAKGNL